jgi:hypothetical protein
MRNINGNRLEELKKLAAPIAKFIEENYDLHTTVIIERYSAKVVRDEICTPLDQGGKRKNETLINEH